MTAGRAAVFYGKPFPAVVGAVDARVMAY